MPRATIRDVAEATGMSKSSVSRILNRAPGYTYDEKTQQRVWQVAEQLGYQAHAAARLLKQQKTHLIGLTAYLTEHPYPGRLVAAVRDALQERGYEPVLVEPEQLSPSRSNAPFPSPELLDGILSFGYSLNERQSKYLCDLRRRLPLVALHQIDSKDVDWVYTDSELGMDMLIEHLLGLGHRRIAFAQTADSPFRSDVLKIKGWKRAIGKYRLDADQLTFIGLKAHSITARADQIVAELLKMKRRPTALMCSGDESALCVMGRLQEKGWKIPGDLSITGFDGIAFGDYCCPRLTTIVQPVDKIAVGAVDRLLEIIEQGPAEIVPRQLLIEPELLARASTAKVKSR